MQQESVIEQCLLRAGAVSLNVSEPYTWASGWKSPIYCDNRKLLSMPIERDLVKSELCRVIFDVFPDADGLAGVATAGIAWGAMVADQLKLPMVYVRPKPKEHGLGNQIEGQIVAGQRVVVVEDLVSTGKSSLQVCLALREAGFHIEGMVSIFTYAFSDAEKSFQEAGITLHSLGSYPVLAAEALKRGLVQAAQMEDLNQWRENPAAWGQ